MGEQGSDLGSLAPESTFLNSTVLRTKRHSNKKNDKSDSSHFYADVFPDWFPPTPPTLICPPIPLVILQPHMAFIHPHPHQAPSHRILACAVPSTSYALLSPFYLVKLFHPSDLQTSSPWLLSLDHRLSWYRTPPFPSLLQSYNLTFALHDLCLLRFLEYPQCLEHNGCSINTY